MDLSKKISVFGFGLLLNAVDWLYLNHIDEDDIVEEESIGQSRTKVIRIKNFVEAIVPTLRDRQFQAHFRLSRVQFENILPLIARHLAKRSFTGRPIIHPQKQFLSVLWILATPDSYRSVGERFDLGKSSLSDSFFRVVQALCSMAPGVIRWSNFEEKEETKLYFQQKSGINGIVGVVDGTFIPIKAPSEDSECYRTRKCNYAMTLQAICNSKMKFTDCFVGFPGSVNDRRIFENSDFYKNLERNNNFNNEEFILGDKAYPVLPWCIPPYIDRGDLTAAQRNFNLRHAQCRQIIERCFALLFGRFRRLRYLDMNRTYFIPKTVLAACVLYNLCLDASIDEIEAYIEEGQQFLIGNEDVVPINLRNYGYAFRDDICRRL